MEPFAPSDLEMVAVGLDRATERAQALRCSGTGLLSTPEHRSPFTFAALYDGPAWLRADIRPSSPAAPSGFSAQMLVENACARMYFPSSLVMVADCVEDLPLTDPSLLLFGLISGEDLRLLEGPEAGRRDGRLLVTGRRGEMQMEFTLDPGSGALTGFEARGDDGAWLTVEYEGHGWKESLPLPRTTTLRFGRGGRSQARVRLEFERLRAIDPVDRNAHDVIPPPGTKVSRWGDLALWR
jgi:hypothetical protein